MLNPLILQEFDNDQRREVVNTRQRFSALRDAEARVVAARGSMVWVRSKGAEYLARSYYEKSGIRKQTSLGPRSEKTEKLKLEFERNRQEAAGRLKTVSAAIDRQAGINRALGLGRVPLLSARILRALDRTGTLGAGLRVVGTHAIFAYEAVAGVMLDPALTTTGDIDFLMDSRGGLRFVVSDEIPEKSLLRVIASVDRSFERTRQSYRAQNADGFLVDLIKPMRNPPWTNEDSQLAGGKADDLTASEIAGLVWLENAPAFEATGIDERGYPVRLVTPDPRVWAAHKLWVSTQFDRDPVKNRRDAAQARAVAALVTQYLPHLPYAGEDLKMLPKEVFERAADLFAAGAPI
jgi:hypothetical protein